MLSLLRLLVGEKNTHRPRYRSNTKARAWAPGSGFRYLKPGPSPLQALTRVGSGLGLNGLGSAGSGLEAQPSTSLIPSGYVTTKWYHKLWGNTTIGLSIRWLKVMQDDATVSPYNAISCHRLNIFQHQQLAVSWQWMPRHYCTISNSSSVMHHRASLMCQNSDHVTGHKGSWWKVLSVAYLQIR